MKNLIARDIYHARAFQERAAFWRKASWVAGILFGAAMAIMATVAFWPFVKNGHVPTILLAVGIIVLISLVGGGLFGVSMGFLSRQSAKRMVNQIYDGVGSFACPPPDENYDFRVSCNWCKSPHFSISGMLYFSPERLVFVPHACNLPRHRESLFLNTTGISFRVASIDIPNYQKWLIPGDNSQVLEIETEKGLFHFGVPQPTATCEKIKERMGQ